jgi:acyl-CoA thioester hydrolase
MAEVFTRTFQAGWGDMDFNAHMRNTAFLDRAADTRMMYFESCGFPMVEFARRRFGPVVLRDEIDYYREVHLLETFDVSLELAGLSADGSRFKLRNVFSRGGKPMALVVSLGGWIDLSLRKFAVPAPELTAALVGLKRSADYAEIAASA